MSLLANDILSVPLFELQRNLTLTQKLEEHVTSSYLKALKDLQAKVKAKEAQGESVDPKKIAEGISRIHARVTELRNQLCVKMMELIKTMESLQARFDTLSMCSGDAPALKRFRELSPTRLTTPNNLDGDSQQQDALFLELCLIANHLLRQGFFKTFEKLCKETNWSLLASDIPFFQRSQRIYTQLCSLSSSSFSPCTNGGAEFEEVLLWCQENRGMLKKFKSLFEFHVRLRQFQLLAAGGGDKLCALEFASKHLAAFTKESELRQSLVELLLFPTTEEGRSNISTQRNLGSEFLFEQHRVVSLLKHSPLETVVRLGLSVCKTNSCSSSREHLTRCPCCHPLFGVIAQSLPTVKQSRSTFACRLLIKEQGGTDNGAKDIQEEDDDVLVVFPKHGHCYSAAGLKKLVDANGNVADPQSGEVCAFKDLKKVFLL